MKIFNNFKKTALIAPILIIAISSCNSDGPEIEQPEKIYYEQAQRRMAAKTSMEQSNHLRQLKIDILLANMLNKHKLNLFMLIL